MKKQLKQSAKLMLVSSTMAIASGCATQSVFHAYDGAQKKTEELAEIRVDQSVEVRESELCISKVGERALQGFLDGWDCPKSVFVLPGEHQVKMQVRNYRKRLNSTAAFSPYYSDVITIDVKANDVYHAYYASDGGFSTNYKYWLVNHKTSNTFHPKTSDKN